MSSSCVSYYITTRVCILINIKNSYTIILDCTDHVPDERPRFGELQQKLVDHYH